MSIRVTTNSAPKGPPSEKYPYLAAWPSGLVVLMIAPLTGVCVMAGKLTKNKVGRYSTTWSEFNAKPYTGSLVLENDQ